MRDKQRNPKILKRVGKTKTRSLMRLTISVRVWKVKMRFTIWI